MTNLPDPQGPRTVADARGQQQRQRFGNQRQDERQDGYPLPAPMGMTEVEERIIVADNELADLTQTHIQIADEAARAEAQWKNHRDRVIILIIKTGEKGAKDTREAHAKQRSCGAMDCPCAADPWAGETLYKNYEVGLAHKDSSAKAMRAIEARLNAFQTIAANLRRVAT